MDICGPRIQITGKKRTILNISEDTKKSHWGRSDFQNACDMLAYGKVKDPYSFSKPLYIKNSLYFQAMANILKRQHLARFEYSRTSGASRANVYTI